VVGGGEGRYQRWADSLPMVPLVRDLNLPCFSQQITCCTAGSTSLHGASTRYTLPASLQRSRHPSLRSRNLCQRSRPNYSAGRWTQATSCSTSNMMWGNGAQNTPTAHRIACGVYESCTILADWPLRRQAKMEAKVSDGSREWMKRMQWMVVFGDEYR